MNSSIDRTKFLMSYNNRTTLNENIQTFEINNTPVITDWLSPDEKFIIFLDELYDIENKIKIGNIWENFDNFKMFLRHSFSVATNVPQTIKESLLYRLDNQLLIESKTNYSSLKPLFKQILNEESWWDWGKSTLNDFGNWIYKKGEETVQGISDFASATYQGAKDLIGAISKGEWTEVLNIIGSGIKYLARRLRDALYHPIGIILDTILVVTGIGKSVQWIPWAIVVALDIYELVFNDFEDDLPYWMRYLFLGLDILGLVSAGGVSAALKTLIGGIKSEAGVLKAVGRETLESMAQSASKAPGLLSRAAEWLASKFPAASTFIKSILGFVERIITDLLGVLRKILSPKSLVAGTTAAGILYTGEKVIDKLKPNETGDESESVDDLMAKNAEYNLIDDEDENTIGSDDLMSGDAEYTI